MDDRQSKYVERATPLYRALFTRIFSGFATPRAAIKAKCLDCVGQEDARNQIRECDITTCALHSLRPFVQREKRPGNRKGNPAALAAAREARRYADGENSSEN